MKNVPLSPQLSFMNPAATAGTNSLQHHTLIHNQNNSRYSPRTTSLISLQQHKYQNLFVALRGGAEGEGGNSVTTGDDIIASFRDELKRMREELEEEAEVAMTAAKEEILRKKKKDKMMKLKEEQQQQQQKIYDDEVNRDGYDDEDDFIVGDTDENDQEVLEKLTENEEEHQQEEEVEENVEFDNDVVSKSGNEDENDVIEAQSQINDENISKESLKDDKNSSGSISRRKKRKKKNKAKAQDVEDASLGRKKKKNRKKKKKEDYMKRRERKKERYSNYEILDEEEVKELHEKLTNQQQSSLKMKEKNHSLSPLDSAIRSLIPTFLLGVLLLMSHFIFQSILKKI